MRKTLGICAALVALAAAIGGAAALRHTGPGPAAAFAGSSALPVSFAAIVPPAAAAPEAAPPPGADLPSVEVPPHLVHTVPDDSATLPAPPVTMTPRDDRLVERAPPPAPRSRATRIAISPATLGGPARPAGGASLGIAGRTVHLFGVRPPDTRERCPTGNGAAASCGDAARAALAARLAANASVSCTLPPGQGGDPGFVCHDAAGVDLGGLLVAEGLALVDRGSSYQYLGAEDLARAQHRGLWRYR